MVTKQFVRLFPHKQQTPKEAPISTTAVTLEDLESERADLLPSRETLHCCHPCGCGGGIIIAVGVLVVL